MMPAMTFPPPTLVLGRLLGYLLLALLLALFLLAFLFAAGAGAAGWVWGGQAGEVEED
jgi:hypothetical protein